MTFVLAALPAAVRVNPTRFPVRHTINVDAVREACERLGVTGAITISYAEYRRGRMAGSYYSQANGGHSITLGYRLSAKDAGETLWHELTHAKQTCEGRNETTFGLSRAAYLAHPIEIEARANERMNDEIPLAA